MSCPNFQTMKHFQLYLKHDDAYYTRVCPECGFVNSSESEVCEDCGTKLDTSAFDEMACQEFYEDINYELEQINSGLNFFKIEAIGGYYGGAQLYVENSNMASRAYSETPFELDNEDSRYYFDMFRSQVIRAWECEQRKVCKLLATIADTWGFENYVCGGLFSNGEAIYYKAGTIKAVACAVA